MILSWDLLYVLADSPSESTANIYMSWDPFENMEAHSRANIAAAFDDSPAADATRSQLRNMGRTRTKADARVHMIHVT